VSSYREETGEESELLGFNVIEEEEIESYRMGGITDSEMNEKAGKELLITDLIGGEAVSDYLDTVPSDPEGKETIEALPFLATRRPLQFDAYEIAMQISRSREYGHKQVDHFLRSYPAWRDEVTSEEGEEMIAALEEGTNHQKKRIFSQYLSVIQDLVSEGSEILDSIYSEFTNDSSKVRATASTPVERLPPDLNSVPNRVKEEAVQIDDIFPRLRGIKGARDCERLESRHYNTLIAEEPTKDIFLLRVDGQLVGSWKEEGQNSILALRDVENNGRYPLRKGWTYKSTWNLWKQRYEAEEKDSWKVLDVDELPVDPLRPAGEKGGKTEEWWRQKIDEKVQQLEEEVF